MSSFEGNFHSSEFSSLLSNTLTISGLERLFGIAFVLTVETGFIPTSLVEHFDSINSNIELAKMINRMYIMYNIPLKSFWLQINHVFIAELVLSNKLCYLTGIPNGNSLIITLSHSTISKCTILENDNEIFNKNPENLCLVSIKFKNLVSVPIKCAILDYTIGQFPGFCGIPEELILFIIIKLDSPDLYALMRCCKKLYYLAINNQFIWKKFVTEELKKVTNQRNHREQSITDWRNYYYELKRKRSGRRKITIVRENHVI